jgi:hypothetical protein
MNKIALIFSILLLVSTPLYGAEECDCSNKGEVDYIVCGDDYVLCPQGGIRPIGRTAGLEPKEYARKRASGAGIVSDLLVTRPLMLCVTAITTCGYIISYPFLLMGDNEKRGRQVLVIDPAKYTFTYPLGSYPFFNKGGYGYY